MLSIRMRFFHYYPTKPDRVMTVFFFKLNYFQENRALGWSGHSEMRTSMNNHYSLSPGFYCASAIYSFYSSLN